MPHFMDIPELVDFHGKRIARLRGSRNLSAPWEVLPEIPRGSIGWRMGPGEDVWIDWLTWLRALTSEQRAEYRTCHPEPESWTGTYERHFAQFQREPHGKNWDDFWDAEFQKQYEKFGPMV